MFGVSSVTDDSKFQRCLYNNEQTFYMDGLKMQMILTANTFENLSKHCVFINLVHGFITSVHVDISCFLAEEDLTVRK